MVVVALQLRSGRVLTFVSCVFASHLRSQDFLSIAAQLKQLSSTFHVPVVVINQVSDFFAGADGNGGEALSIDQVKHSYLHHWSMMSSGRRVVPALGLTWANCVNTRIFLTRRHEFVQPGRWLDCTAAASVSVGRSYSIAHRPLHVLLFGFCQCMPRLRVAV